MDSAMEPQFNQLKEVIELNYIVSSFQSQRTHMLCPIQSANQRATLPFAIRIANFYLPPISIFITFRNGIQQCYVTSQAKICLQDRILPN